MTKISALTLLTETDPEDYIAIVDSSGLTTKRVKLRDLVGYPTLGWIAAAETWSLITWSDSNNIGIIQVPSDATTKYAVGMTLQLTQTTGGTKFFKVGGVTSTTLSIRPLGDYRFENEPATSPLFTTELAPFGAPGVVGGENLDKTQEKYYMSAHLMNDHFIVDDNSVVDLGDWDIILERSDNIDPPVFDPVLGTLTIKQDGILRLDASLVVSGGDGLDDTNLWGWYRGGASAYRTLDNWRFHSRVGQEYPTTLSGLIEVSKDDVITLGYSSTANNNSDQMFIDTFSKVAYEFTPDK